MKKALIITVIALSTVTMTTANAKAMICGYTDHMHMGSQSPAKPVIQGAVTANGAVTGVKTGVDSFDIVDNQGPGGCDMGSEGTVHVTYAATPSDYCILNFVDSPSYDNPKSVNAQCVGRLKYLGADYDGLFSYSYSMMFSM